VGIIDRRVWMECLIPALLCLAISTFLLFTTQILRIAEAAFGKGLTISDFVMVLLLILPRLFVFTLPISILVGVTAGLGRLSDDNEILALEAAGQSPLRLWRAPLLLALLGAALAGYLAQDGEPRALGALADRLGGVVASNLVLGLNPGVIHEEIPGAVIFAASRDPESGTLKDVLIQLDREGQKGTVIARQARLSPGGGQRLSLHVGEGELTLFGDTREGTRPTLTQTHFASGLVGLDISQTFARRVRFIGSLDVLLPEALSAAIESAKGPEKIKAQQVFYRRIALPFGCLALAILAIPLGLSVPNKRGGKRGLGVLLGILAVAFYFVAGRVCEAWAASGHLPLPLGPLVPTLVLTTLGLSLLWRRTRQ